MKAQNLKILQENKINVPPFIVVDKIEKIDLEFSNEEYFAVRSSFDVEDSADSSFAGQFDTYLNVNRKDVPNVAKQVMESASNKNVEEYVAARTEKNKEVNITAIKNDEMNQKYNIGTQIIVQEMVEAKISGVMFSANPIGILNEIVIVVGFGLGCDVVEDKADTTTYYYNKDDESFYYETTNDSPVLNEKELKELLENCSAITQIFGREMDVEFAIRNDEIFILQVRPITTLGEGNIILDNSNIVESYPGVSLPLTQSFVKDVYYRVFKSLLLRVTKDQKLVNSMDEILINMTDIANGRIYYRISNWYEILRLLPFSKRIIPMWQEMLGVNNKMVSVNEEKVHLRTKFVMTLALVSALIKTPKKMRELNTFFDKYIAKTEKDLDKLIEKNISSQEKMNQLLCMYESIFDVLVEKWDITLINDMYTFIFTALSGRKNRDMIANIKNLESMKPVEEINKLVFMAQNEGMMSERLHNAKIKYISIYGDRCLCELKLETRTYRTNPEMLDEYIKDRIQRNTKENKNIDDSENIDDSKNSDGADIQKEKNPSKNGFFIKRAKMGIANREISRLNRTRIFGLARKIFLTIGEELVKQEKIKEREDIFYLHISECQDLTSNMQMLKDRISDRVVEYKMYGELPAFSRLVFSGKIINKKIHNPQFDVLNKPNELIGTSASLGTPASLGRVVGEVLVIKEPNQNIDTRNKIIVTQMTDPGWVFLIENSAGIIAEKGSILSHTAIITRELGKPSIVNVKDATRILKSGDIVEMDTNSGKITVVDRIKK